MKLFIHISFSLLIAQGAIFSQSFNVDEQVVTIAGDATVSDISNNTDLNALTNASLSWSVSNTSIPLGWDYSFCFPNCYAIGQTSGTLNITAGVSYYLNCHVYPNDISGEGSITMLIAENNGSSMEVTWEINAGIANLDENSLHSQEANIKAIFNIEGKRFTELIKNQIQFIVFEDNSMKKIFITE